MLQLLVLSDYPLPSFQEAYRNLAMLGHQSCKSWYQKSGHQMNEDTVVYANRRNIHALWNPWLLLVHFDCVQQPIRYRYVPPCKMQLKLAWCLCRFNNLMSSVKTQSEFWGHFSRKTVSYERDMIHIRCNCHTLSSVCPNGRWLSLNYTGYLGHNKQVYA